MFKCILVFVICYNTSVIGQQKPPQLLPWQEWLSRIMFYRIINMTGEIVHDTTRKLKQAERVRDMHKHSITYELGSISAGIQERFQRMLKTYRKHANYKDFKAATYSGYSNIMAFHAIQGDYNEIKLEKELYYEIKKRHDAAKATSVDYKKALLSSMLPPYSKNKAGGGRRKWAPKEETYNKFPG